MTIPLVRLSRDRRWAVCANVDCGERIAARIDKSALISEAIPEGLRPPRATLDFLPGWTNSTGGWPDEEFPGGVWMMSGRVRQRVSAGKPPAYRRPPRDPDEAPWNPRDRSGLGITKNAYVYPALVICPACHSQQLADAGVLELR